MKFKLDENISPALASILTSAGHDARSVVGQGIAAAALARVLTLLASETLTGTLWIVEDHRIRIHE